MLEWRKRLVIYTIHIPRTRSHMLSKIERRVLLNVDDEIARASAPSACERRASARFLAWSCRDCNCDFH
jgi:hypothetical protein